MTPSASMESLVNLDRGGAHMLEVFPAWAEVLEGLLVHDIYPAPSIQQGSVHYNIVYLHLDDVSISVGARCVRDVLLCKLDLLPPPEFIRQHLVDFGDVRHVLPLLPVGDGDPTDVPTMDEANRVPLRFVVI
ncbi:unnamed protein product [Cuscuta campestris]|uniref:Uncharacterized protein n=1 Tax=Cuscuta campestris TaxID=132261 RepID=A0A484K655_9ASTE|nr:unnamed protein product [Cuscuta campestris]